MLHIERQRVTGIADRLGEEADELTFRKEDMRVAALGVVFERDVADGENVFLLTSLKYL
ncbi:MAG: hypothetical protein ACI9GK_000661 [Devosia sp.]